MRAPAAGRPHHAPHAFWRHSLRVYRLPGVEAALLAMQDQWGTDTNMLLYCCWLAGAGRSLDRRHLRRAMTAVARWQLDVIQPLRHARRAVKSGAAALPQQWAADLRRRLGRLELDLEYLEQCSLLELARQLPPPRRPQPQRAAAQASIARYLELLALPEAATSSHVTIVLEACWPPARLASPAPAPGRR